ncbi:MAG TPA: ABC transporter permease [Vicinamibacterales bacterium]|nr:ABC transporter permease [Vicinamibacterales bacterium]
MTRRSTTRGDRLYRLLLRMFPSDFRGDFGGEMVEDFRDQRKDAYRARGSAGLALLWCRTVLGFLRQAPREQFDALAGDVRYALRMMRRHVVSTLVIVLLLSVGIGANVAVFGFADPMVRRPLPVPEFSRMFRMARSDGDVVHVFSHADYRSILERARTFSIAAHQYTTVSLGPSGADFAVDGEAVSGTYFQVYGISPALGRFLQPADDEVVGAHPVVVISHGFWREHFAGAGDAVGRVIHLNGHPFEVIGVAPEGFSGSYTAFNSRFWAPVTMYRQVRPRPLDLDRRGWGWLWTTVRLNPGVTWQEAAADLERISGELDREYPFGDARRGYYLIPASGLPEGTRRTASPVLVLATTLGVLVLLVTCANIAGVLQSRAVTRVHETAVRHALGASRFRIVRQWLTESVCLALAGGLGGLLAARWMHAGMSRLLESAVDHELATLSALDGRVLLFAAALAVGSGLAFGLLPALRAASRGEATLRETALALAGSRRAFRSTRLLVAMQVGVCLCLLVAAGLLARSMHNARTFDVGFDDSSLVLARLDLERHGYDAARTEAFYETLAARLRARPDVVALSRANVVPLGGEEERLGFLIPGYTPPDGKQIVSIDVSVVGRDYFPAIGIPIVRGRGFTERDRPTGRVTAVVNETMARRYWPSKDAVGQTLVLAGPTPRTLEVIGVAKDIKYYSIDEAPRPYLYVSSEESGAPAGTLHVRVNGSAEAFVATLRQETAALDPSLAPLEATTFAKLRERPLSLRRAMSLIAAAFGALALVLAVVGLYGTMSNAVGQRTREIGVRMAFGARGPDVFRLIVRQALAPVFAGLLLGLGASGLVTPLIASELFEVGPGDPATYAVATGGLVLAAFAAVSAPARRATRVDPIAILRQE